MINNIFNRILNRLHFFDNKIININRVFYGIKWKIPIINGLGYDYSYGKNTEKWIFNTLKTIHEIYPIQKFVDVGVNTGQTLIKIKSINPDVDYLGFEPSVICCHYVHQLVTINNLSRIELITAGLGESAGIMTLRSFGDSDTRASLSLEQITDAEATFSASVPVLTFDSVVDGSFFDKNCLIKIDVEGFELNVIKGSNHFLNKIKPIIVFEVLPNHGVKSKVDNANNLFNYLTELGFEIFSIQQEPTIFNKTQSLSANKDDYAKTDFLALHKSNHELLISKIANA